jgi:hypothetical protein
MRYYGTYDLPDPPEHPVAKVLYYVGVGAVAIAWTCLGIVALIFGLAGLVGLVMAL